jgi:inosine-uridine nucleoside N-ribohydrolase
MLMLYPEVKPSIRSIVIMGGAVGVGSQSLPRTLVSPPTLEASLIL